MSNIVEIVGTPPVPLETIGDMKSGDKGWCVPWAVRDGSLNEEFTIYLDGGGTSDLFVECLSPHKYRITYGK